VRLWNPATGEEIFKFSDHHDYVLSVSFSPDGRRLATASADGTVKIRDPAAGQVALTLKDDTKWFSQVAFSPDGCWLATSNRDGTVMLWDARPWTPEAPLEREALGLLHFLFARPLSRDHAIEYLRGCRTIRTPARKLALSWVGRFRQETNPARYDAASRLVARQRYLNAFQYQFALRQAQTACSLAPENASYRTTLGMAQYRVGRYAEALATLARADPSRPASLAFLAMAQHRRGQKDPAQVTLRGLQEALKLPGWAASEEARAFLGEAEAVVQPAAAERKE
jgi:tetratricopeptide (TPR) repeat protein